MPKFTNMTFEKQCTSIRKRLTLVSGDIQVAILNAVLVYVKDKADYDAPARLLNAIKDGRQLRMAQVVSQYITAHEPSISLEYGVDSKTGKKRWFCKKADTDEQSIEMTTPWYEWDAAKTEQEMRNADSVIAMLERVCNNNTQYDEQARSVALAAITAAKLAYTPEAAEAA